MSYEQFFDRLMARRRNVRGRSARQCRRLRLSLEPLEDRRLLSAVSFQAEELQLPDVASDSVLESTLAEGIFSIPKTGLMGKLSNTLTSTFGQYGAYLSQAGRPGFQPANSLVQVSDGLIQINAVASDDTDALLADLESLGFQAGSTWGSRISGRIALDAVDELAELDSLQLASAALRPWTNVGATDSQGDASMNADLARAQFGVDGSGVTVGVLSNSFNTSGVGSYAADVASGDLPAGINVLADYPGSTDEGRGMMQLIHDVAPGAEMAFHTAYSTEVDFANGILALAGAGADIIVDDIIYLEEPMFQDGVIAQAVDTVEAGGIPYFSSAGNSDRNSYESAFVDSGISLEVDGQPRGMLHDFDPTAGVDPLQSIYVPFFSGFLMSFQWDQPFFSVSGGAGATNDLDIYLTSPDGTSVYAQSVTRNIGGDPVEVLQFTNNVDFLGQFSLLIANYGGPDPGLMKFVSFDTGFSPVTLNEYNTDSSTTFGHANAAGAEAVGAAFYGDTPAFGQDPPLLESFSSAGGTPILFDTAGNRLATPEIREKPGIVAPDGTNTSFFPQGNDTDGDGYPNFYGTSAAAPHAAAVAALMLQLNPSLSPADVYSTLESTAIDMDVAGFDFNTGYGLIQADVALANIPSDPRLSISIDGAEISENGGSTTASITRWNTDLGSPLNVTLASSDTTEATVPATVTIPADASSATFVISGVDDSLSDGEQTVTITATAAGLLDGHDMLRVIDDEPQLISQWAATIVDFSTEWYDPFNPGAWQAIQALGAPDTFQYGDIETAWEASTADGNGVEYLTLGYATPVLATGATIRETYGNGFVTRIEVREAGTSTLHTVWSGTDPSLPGSPVDFEVSWPQTGFFVDALKVTVNSYHVTNDWEAIDAVQLEGWKQPPISDTTAPAAPAGLTVNVPVSLSGVLELDWADNTEGDLAGYNIYRSETSGGSYSQIAAGVINSDYTDAGLADQTTYYYVVTAVDTSGNESGNSAEASGTLDSVAPLPPIDLIATDRLGDQGHAIDLTWTISTSGDAVGQRLYRGVADGGPYALMQTFGSNSTNSYTDTDAALTNGATYYYVIRAYDGGQESIDSNQASAAPIDNLTPAAPVGLTVNLPVNLGRVLELDWVDNTDSDLTGYNGYRNEISGGAYGQIAAGVINSDYTDTGLTDGTPYYYVVTAVDASGNESGNSAEASGIPDNAVPLPPTNLTAVDRPDDQGQAIELTWTVSSSGDAVGQRLYRGLTDGGPYALVEIFSENSTNSHIDEGPTLSNDRTFYYVIRAYDGSQQSVNSNQASAIPTDNLTLAAPTGLTVSAPVDLDGVLELDWADNTDSDLAGYNVYRSETSGGSYSQIATDVINSDYADTGLIDGTTYYYVITAVDSSGNESGNSAEAWGTPDNAAPLPPMSLTAADRLADQGQAIELNWTVSTSGDAVGQRLYRGITDGGPYALVQTFGDNSTNSYTDSVLTNDITYYYVIRAYDGGQESIDSNQASAAPIDNLTPAAPTGLAATAGDGQVVLNFDGNGESDLAGYNVYRSQTSGGPYSPVNPSLLNVTTYTDTNVTNGTTYYYVVTAVDTSANESPGSGEASATPQSVTTPVQALATSDIPVAGSVSNNYTDTRASDGIYQSITERESGGKRQNRYSYLEHKWTFDATPGSAVAFHLEAHATASSDGDEFVFAYSTDDSNYVDMLTVTKTSDDNSYQTYALPGSINGTVYVRVRDTDRGRGNRSRDTISVDHMYIETMPGDVDFAPSVSLAQPVDGNSVSGSQLIQIDATDPEDALGTLAVEWSIDGGAWKTASYNGLTAYYEATWDTTAAAEGSHTINARAADSMGNVTANSVGVTVDNIVTSTMHVGDIDGRAKLKGKKWQAYVTVLIHDDAESPLSNAIVTGTWSGSFGGTASGTTGSDGSVTFATSSISNGDNVTFTVDTVSGSLAYSPGENHDGDLPADSSGTAILVNRDNTTAAPLLANLDVALADLFLDEDEGNRRVQGWDIANNLRAVDRLMATFGS